MYVDAQCLLEDGADMSQVAGSYYSEFAYNLGSTKDPGGGRPLYLVICVDEAFASAASTAKVVFALVDEADATIDTDSVEIIQTDPLLVTRLTLGKVIVLPIPAGLITQQYLGLRTTISVQTTSAGKITAFIAVDPFTNPGA